MEPLVVSADLESLEPIHNYLQAAAQEAGFDQRAAYRLALAVDEIVTNSIKHGYMAHHLRGDLYLQATVGNGMATVILEEDAPPFDPRTRALPPDLSAPLDKRMEGGLGIFLALNAVDGYEYAWDNGRNRHVFVVQMD